ncbi:hypothetical protein P692DRAFT_20881760 [Suillus brevipes Sb2]|nr:hypothetical protein P692DRAFT_20881760 [Suillus brevipes Sb2]
MLVDEPHALELNGTTENPQYVSIQNINIDLAENENRNALLAANHKGRMSPNKRKLVRNLEKVVNKCIDRNCEGNPTTDILRERIYAAIEGAILGVEVDEIMRRHVPKAENIRTSDKTHKLSTNNDNLISPAAQYIFNGMRRLFSLGKILSAQSEPHGPSSSGTVPDPLEIIRRSDASLRSAAGMPGQYHAPTA